MANTYEITAPDGNKYRITAPPGATEADAIDYVKNNIGSLTAQPPVPASPQQSPTQPQSIGQQVLNSPIGGAIRGVRDIVDGGAQLATRGLESLPSALGIDRHPAAKKFQEFMSGQRQNVEDINQQAEQDYRQNWRQGEDTGLDVGRIAGNIAGSIPLAYAIPGMTAATGAGKTAYGAASGMAGAAAQPVLNNNANFWDEKMVQAGIGGIAGAAGPHIANIVGKGAGAIKRAITPAMPQEQVIRIVTESLKQKGVNFNRLTKETQDELLAQAQKSLNVGADLNLDELARKADFDQLGMKPTAGQLSHDPLQVRFEKNTAGITGAGDDLAQRFNQQNQQLISNVNQLKQTPSVDSYQAGQTGIDLLKQVDTGRQAGVGKLYDKAINEIGVDTPLNPQRFMDDVASRLDDMISSFDELPAGVNTKLSKIASGEIPLTIKKAEQVRKAINKRMASASQSEKVSLRVINDALQNEIDAVGMPAGQAYQQARAAASERFGQIELSPAMRDVVKDVATPDDFFKKYVMGAKAAPLRALKNDINEADPQFWGQVKSQVIDFLKQGALGDASDDLATFSQSGFNKALNKIGNEKLKVFFAPIEIRQLRTIGRVSESIAKQPVGANVNNSNTTAALMNILNLSSNVPMLQLAADPLKRGLTQRAATKALNPSFTPPQNVPGLSPQAMSRLNLPFSVAGYPLVKPMLE